MYLFDIIELRAKLFLKVRPTINMNQLSPNNQNTRRSTIFYMLYLYKPVGGYRFISMHVTYV